MIYHTQGDHADHYNTDVAHNAQSQYNTDVAHNAQSQYNTGVAHNAQSQYNTGVAHNAQSQMIGKSNNFNIFLINRPLH